MGVRDAHAPRHLPRRVADARGDPQGLTTTYEGQVRVARGAGGSRFAVAGST